MNDVDRIYSASIKWLAYTPLASMTVEEKKDHRPRHAVLAFHFYYA